MARPSVVVVCTNVAQAGRIAQGLGTKHGQDGSDHDHNLNGSRAGRHGREGSQHHDDRSGSHTASATRSGGRTRSSTAVRVWKVYDGKTLHEVQDLGTRLEARSEDGGGPVWTGVRLPSGAYETRSTTLPTQKLASFLQKVHDGDQTTPGGHEAPASARRAAPASAKRAVQHRPATTAPRSTRKPVSKPHSEAARTEPSTPTPKKRGRPPKKAAPATSAPPKSKAPASKHPKSKAPASKHPKSKSTASPKPRQPAKAKRHAATKTTVHGPATSRSPGSMHETPASMRRRLHQRNPETPETALATLEDIWRGGASEPARAWMIAKGFTDLADAFVDWVEHHTTEANGFMQAARAQRSA